MSFKPSELQMNYIEFSKFIRKCTLSPREEQWLRIWLQLDFSLSPMDDGKRSIIRYGHYLGFMSNIIEMPKNDTPKIKKWIWSELNQPEIKVPVINDEVIVGNELPSTPQFKVHLYKRTGRKDFERKTYEYVGDRYIADWSEQ